MMNILFMWLIVIKLEQFYILLFDGNQFLI
ncbi:Uncharacterised protein [Escherichia coli]|nr:Uncharacterised protein [Escherichia coli]